MNGDNELIARWKHQRDITAYRQLKSRHKKMVFLYVNKYNGSPVPKEARRQRLGNILTTPSKITTRTQPLNFLLILTIS